MVSQPPSSNNFPYGDVPVSPADPMFELTTRFVADSFSQKVSLGAGAYKDDHGRPWILPSIQIATERLLADPTFNHEYQSIQGLPRFVEAAAKLVLGEGIASSGRVASVQTISGTGACHLGALFLSRFYDFPDGKRVHIPSPTWMNHNAVLENVGIEPVDYAYYDDETKSFDFDGFVNAVESAPDRSVFLLHACAHNPTGFDPSPEQWKVLAEIFYRRKHFAFWDSAYQGFTTGSLETDRFAIDLFNNRSEGAIPGLVAQSFSKNCGLYGQRVGCLHVLCASSEQKVGILSQLKALTRCEISTPPAFGARLVDLVLNTPEIYEQWTTDIVTMASRVKESRKALRDGLVAAGTPGTWDHIVEQQGMFSYTGLSPSQCEALVEKYHIYLPDNGRISMAGVNTNNCAYVVECFDKVVRDYPN